MHRNEPHKIGDKYTLWQTRYDSNAYTDQMGISTTGYIVTKEFQVTVIEVRNDVPDMWVNMGGVK